MLAGLLHRAGVSMGERLDLPSESNPDGHYEDLEVVQLHDAILARHGTNWQYIDPHPLSLEGDEWVAMHLYARKRAQGLCWGVKDPRQALFADAWRQILPHARWILIYRHPAECHDSLARRHAAQLLFSQGDMDVNLRFWQEPSLSWRMWLNYHRSLLNAINKVPDAVLVISHQALFDHRANDALSALSELTGADILSHAKRISHEWSAGSVSQPPLEPALVNDIEEMWQRLQEMAGKFSDLRLTCTQLGWTGGDQDSLERKWSNLADLIFRQENTNFDEATPQQNTEAASAVFDSPREVLKYANGMHSAEDKHSILAEGIKKFPDDQGLLLELALSYRAQECFCEARECLERALTVAPDNPVLWRQLAYISAAQKKFREALDYLNHAWPLAASNAALLAELCVQAGHLHHQRKNNWQALLYAEMAQHLRPAWPPAHRLLDRLTNISNLKAYLETLDSAYRAGQTDATVVLPFASLLQQYGRMSEARTILEKFLTGEPYHRRARQLLVTSLRGMGEYVLAQKAEQEHWQEILAEPRCAERICALRNGLQPWAANDLHRRIMVLVEKTFAG